VDAFVPLSIARRFVSNEPCGGGRDHSNSTLLRGRSVPLQFLARSIVPELASGLSSTGLPMALARRREKRKSDVPLLYRGFLKGVQVSVETIGSHQVIVRAHFGHDAAIDYANHVSIPYGG